jgi:hypothetical protein
MRARIQGLFIEPFDWQCLGIVQYYDHCCYYESTTNSYEQ